MIRYYYRIAWRNLWRSKTTTFINLFGLSAGITSAVLILLWVQNERSFDTEHKDVQNIYRIVNHLRVSKTEEWILETSPFPLASEAKEDIPEIETTTRIANSEWETPVFNINNKFLNEKKCAYIDNNWFIIFHYDLKEGNIASFLNDPYGMILTESKAGNFFGNQAAIGQIIKIDSNNYTVRAIVKDNPSNSSFQFDILMRLSVYVANQKKSGIGLGWGNFDFITFLKLKKAANPNAVEKKLNAVLVKNRGKDNDAGINLRSLTSMHFDTSGSFSAFKHQEERTSWIFSVLALMLLLIACINYINLTTARASQRGREVSIRKIVGADSKHLFGQFITESFVVSLIAFMISLLLIMISIPYFNQLTEMNFVFCLNSFMVWKVLVGTLLIAIILNGIYPALLLSSFKPLHVFWGKSVLKINDTGLRKGLVVFQFTFSVMLIIGTLVVFKQLQFIQSSDPGYNRARIISVQLPVKTLFHMDAAAGRFIENIKYELSKNVNTQLVTSANQPIVNLTNINSGSSKWDGKDSIFNPTVHTLSVDALYQKVFELKMKEGRWYFPDDKDDLKNYILNETAVQAFHLHQPVVGQPFSFNNRKGTIIGIVKDFHHSSMHEWIEPVLIYHNPISMSYIFVKTREGNARKTLAVMQTIWHNFLPSEPFDYTFMDESFDTLYKSDIKTSKLIFVFSIITIIISALGLFGLAEFTAERKTKEIGIRKVMGATVADVASLLSKEFIILVGLAILIACPIAWWVMNKWLENFIYRINIAWWIFLVAGFIAFFIALFTIGFLAMKAALANPVKSLRTE